MITKEDLSRWRGGFVRSRSGQIGLDGQQIGESFTLLIGELSTVAVRVESGLALRRGHFTKLTEGTGDHATAVLRKSPELTHSSHHLLALRRRETFHRFVALNQTLPLLRRHVIELGKPVAQMLLCLGGKLAKARLILQRVLLLREREIAVAAHPLLQMLLLPRPATYFARSLPSLTWARLISHGPLTSSSPWTTPRGGGKGGHGCRKNQRHQRRLEDTPKFG